MTVAYSNLHVHGSYPVGYSYSDTAFSPFYSQASPTLAEGQFPPQHPAHTISTPLRRPSAPSASTPALRGVPTSPFPSSSPSHHCSGALLCSSTTIAAGTSSLRSSPLWLTAKYLAPHSFCHHLRVPAGCVLSRELYCHVRGCDTGIRKLS